MLLFLFIAVSLATLNPVVVTQDSFITPRGKRPDTNYGTGSLIHVRTGRSGLVQFDISSIAAGDSIESASLQLTTRSAIPFQVMFDVFAISKSWTEFGVTAVNRNYTGTEWGTLGLASPDDYDESTKVSTALPSREADVLLTVVLWDVTSIVRAWHNGSLENNGFFVSTQTNGLGLNFISKENTREAKPPELIITTPSPAVADFQPTSGPEVGGNTVVISGSNLGAICAVYFGPNNATIVSNSGAEIVLQAPDGTGVVDIVVNTPNTDKKRADTTIGSYTFLEASFPAE